MCLGVPGQILKIEEKTATVDFWGTRRPVRLDHLDTTPSVGDYIIDHAGYAVRIISVEDVADTLALYEVLLTEAGEDPIARDVMAEMNGLIEVEDEELILV